MKLALSTLLPALALGVALTGAAPVQAAAAFSIDFEKAWDYTDGSINGYYDGGTAADGSTASLNQGVSFVNMSGLSNDANFTYYANSPSPLGIAFVSGVGAFMNVAQGVDNIQFSYSSGAAVSGAVKAYSELNGMGTLLGTFNAVATGGSFDLVDPTVYLYNGWQAASFNFSGTVKSFDLSGASTVAFDNISAVPEPSSVLMVLVGGLLMAGVARKRTR